MSEALTSAALDQVFLAARTAHKFTSKPVSDDTLHQLYDLYKWGPTSLNCQPARLVFVKSAAAKEKLKASLMPNNVEQTMSAPVTAIVAYDSKFFEHLDSQFPAMPGIGQMFAHNEVMAQDTAFRNGSLQGAYLIIAARMLGLDSGAMSGFNPQAVNEAFFADGRWKTNFLINLGYGDAAGNYPRGPRLDFAQAVRID